MGSLSSLLLFSLRKKKTNYFIVSLAFADLLVAVVVMPFAAIELATGRWRYGEIFCLVRTSLDVQLTTASILHLCCIALDRCVSAPGCLRTTRFLLFRALATWTLPAGG